MKKALYVLLAMIAAAVSIDTAYAGNDAGAGCYKTKGGYIVCPGSNGHGGTTQ